MNEIDLDYYSIQPDWDPPNELHLENTKRLFDAGIKMFWMKRRRKKQHPYRQKWNPDAYK